MSAIRTAITTALEEKRWPLTTLAQEVGKDEDTLRNWRDGKVLSYHMPSLVKIFEFAGLSMDEAFGLASDGPPVSTLPADERRTFEDEIERLHVELGEEKKTRKVLTAALDNRLGGGVEDFLGHTLPGLSPLAQADVLLDKEMDAAVTERDAEEGEKEADQA